MASVELHMQINDAYMPVLSIPVTDCNRFSLKPLSWLRFLGYSIYGRIGDISSTPDGPPIDYQMAVQAGTHYYFTSPGAHISLDTGFKLIILFNRDASAVGHSMYKRQILRCRDYRKSRRFS